jgi:hypothetical protein
LLFAAWQIWPGARHASAPPMTALVLPPEHTPATGGGATTAGPSAPEEVEADTEDADDEACGAALVVEVPALVDEAPALVDALPPLEQPATANAAAQRIAATRADQIIRGTSRVSVTCWSLAAAGAREKGGRCHSSPCARASRTWSALGRRSPVETVRDGLCEAASRGPRHDPIGSRQRPQRRRRIP